MNHTALLITTALTGYAAAGTTDGTEINTGLGRIVFGNPFRSQDKMKDGVKVIGQDGQPVKVITFGVAFPRAEFEQTIWPVMAAEAAKLFGAQPPANFSYKYKDGDSAQAPYYNGKAGTPYNQREGYPGHIVLTVSTELSGIQCVKFANGSYHQIGERDIKTGDYVQLSLSIKAHAGQTPGLYVNPGLVLLCYEGDPIVGSGEADPTQKFGAAPTMAPMPAGARAVGAGPAMGGMPGQAASMGQMPGMAAPAPAQPQGMHGQGYAPAALAPQGMMPGGMQMPMAQPQQLPPPATDFIPAAPAPAMQPGGMPGMAPAGQMPGNGGMPGMMPPR